MLPQARVFATDFVGVTPFVTTCHPSGACCDFLMLPGTVVGPRSGALTLITRTAADCLFKVGAGGKSNSGV